MGCVMEDVKTNLQKLREIIPEYLKEGFGEYFQDKDGDFSIFYESAKIFICPREWMEGKTVVRVFSIINVDIPESPELYKFLATENFNLLLGNLSYDENNLAVWFGHVLLGEEVRAESLITVISMVAILADKYDDLIKQKFGGLLYMEVYSV